MKSLKPRGARGRMTRRRDPGQRTGLIFALRFVASWLCLAFLLGLIPQLEQIGIRATLWSLGRVLPVFPTRSLILDDQVTLGVVSFQIVSECTSLLPTGILGAAILAFPAPWRSRASALLVGSVLLWVFNMLRILVLFGVMTWLPRAFDLVHVYLWQPFMLIAVIMIFLTWVSGVARSPMTIAAHTR